MKRSSNIDQFVKGHEALRLTGYLDPTGHPTIGWGHTATAEVGKTITKQEAQRLYESDAANAEAIIKKYVLDKGVTLNQNQYDALFSMVFNIKPASLFTKVYNNGYPFGSVFYNKLLERDYEGAAERITDFNKSKGVVLPGLVRRREEEQRIFKKKLFF